MLPSLAHPLILAGSLLVATAAHAETLIQMPPNAVSYLVFYDRIRAFRLLQLVGEGQHDQAVAQSVFDEETYRRNLYLWPRGAVAEEELRISDIRRQVSALSVERYIHDAAASALQVAIHVSLLPYVAGEAVDIEKIYQIYQRVWEEQCLTRSFRLREALAKKDLAGYRLALTARLVPSGAASHEELDLRQSEDLQAAAEAHTSQALLDTCREGVPSLELIKSLAGGGGIPPP